MDKETAIAIEQLKAGMAEVKKTADETKQGIDKWKSFLWEIMAKSVLWLLALTLATATFGYHLPENIRKSVANIILNWGGE